MFSVGHSIIIEWCQFLMIESFNSRPLSATCWTDGLLQESTNWECMHYGTSPYSGKSCHRPSYDTSLCQLSIKPHLHRPFALCVIISCLEEGEWGSPVGAPNRFYFLYWGIAKWLRQMTLTHSSAGSNPAIPANFYFNMYMESIHIHIFYLYWK